MKIKVTKPKRQVPRRELTLEQIFRYIPKKHRDKFNPSGARESKQAARPQRSWINRPKW